METEKPTLEDAKEFVCRKDGRTWETTIGTDFELEYTRRAYDYYYGKILESHLQDQWVFVKEKMPDVGQKVLLELQHWNTKGFRYYECKCVDEGDCSFRTVDDNSEISYDWTPIRWSALPAQPKKP